MVFSLRNMLARNRHDLDGLWDHDFVQSYQKHASRKPQAIPDQQPGNTLKQRRLLEFSGVDLGLPWAMGPLTAGKIGDFTHSCQCLFQHQSSAPLSESIG